MAKSKSADGPVIGQIVHYVLSYSPARGQCRPALVTLLLPDGAINLSVFPDGGDQLPAVFHTAGAVYDRDGTPGTWHVAERDW